jgi:hypothetical protein
MWNVKNNECVISPLVERIKLQPGENIQYYLVHKVTDGNYKGHHYPMQYQGNHFFSGI